jgi:hypothetical protein
MCAVAKIDTSAVAKLNTAPGTAPKKPSFDADVKPILQSRCQPCHFQGGKVYDHLWFDRPETITKLGEKMFTRIKDKEEQRLIREFLAQP